MIRKKKYTKKLSKDKMPAWREKEKRQGEKEKRSSRRRRRTIRKGVGRGGGG